MNWVIPAPVQYSNPSSPHAVNHDGLVSKLQGVALHEPNSTNQVPVETHFSRSTSEEFTSHSQAGGEESMRGSSQQDGFEPATGA